MPKSFEGDGVLRVVSQRSIWVKERAINKNSPWYIQDRARIARSLQVHRKTRNIFPRDQRHIETGTYDWTECNAKRSRQI